MSEKELQSILLEDLKILLPGLSVQRLGLNQHMPRVEKLSVHTHAHWQALLYLRGQGTQHLDQTGIPIQRGSLLIIPPNEEHRFVKSRHLRPVCLVFDFQIDEPLDWKQFSSMSEYDLKQIERLLVRINESHRKPVSPSIPLATYILSILGVIQKTACSNPGEVSGPVTQRMENLLRNEAIDVTGLTPALVAARFQVSLDHLNRLLHSESSPSVGKMITDARLGLCYRLLRESPESIGEVASRSGYPDQNYFSRWFRKQTGQTPLQWRNAQQGG